MDDVRDSLRRSETNFLVIFYDGACLMCSGTMRLLHRLDEKDELRFAPLGGEVASQLNIPNGESVVVYHRGESFQKSEALRMIIACLFPAPVAFLFQMIPCSWRDFLYDLIAARRSQLSRFVTQCEVPEQGFQDKFLP